MKKYLPQLIIAVLIYFLIRCVIGFTAAAERQNQVYHVHDSNTDKP